VTLAERAAEWLTAIGATPEEPWYLVLETTVGRLLIHPSDNGTVGPGTMYCRFQDVDRAVAKLTPTDLLGRLNRYSGKWNFSYFDGWTADTAFADFQHQINRLL